MEMMSLPIFYSVFSWLFYLPFLMGGVDADIHYIDTDTHTCIYSEIQIEKMIQAAQHIENRFEVSNLFTLLTGTLSNQESVEAIDALITNLSNHEHGIRENGIIKFAIPDFISFSYSIKTLSDKSSYSRNMSFFPDAILAIPYSNTEEIWNTLQTVFQFDDSAVELKSFRGHQLYYIETAYTYKEPPAYPFYSYDFDPDYSSEPPEEPPTITIPVEKATLFFTEEYVYISNRHTLQSAILAYFQEGELAIRQDFGRLFYKYGSDHMLTLGYNIAAYFNSLGPDLRENLNLKSIITLDIDSSGLDINGYVENDECYDHCVQVKKEAPENPAISDYFTYLPGGNAGFFQVQVDLKEMLNRLPLQTILLPAIFNAGGLYMDEESLFLEVIRNFMINFNYTGSIVVYGNEQPLAATNGITEVNMLGYFDILYPYRAQELIHIMEQFVRQQTENHNENFQVNEITIADHYFYSFEFENRAFNPIAGVYENFFLVGTNRSSIEQFIHNLERDTCTEVNPVIPHELTDRFENANVAFYLPFDAIYNDSLLESGEFPLTRGEPFMPMYQRSTTAPAELSKPPRPQRDYENGFSEEDQEALEDTSEMNEEMESAMEQVIEDAEVANSNPLIDLEPEESVDAIDAQRTEFMQRLLKQLQDMYFIGKSEGGRSHYQFRLRFR